MAPDEPQNSPGMSQHSASPQSDENCELEEEAANKDAQSVPRNESSLDIVTDGMWSCSKCTFLNHEVMPYCEMCNAVKPRQTSVSSERNVQSKPKRSSNSKRKMHDANKVSSQAEQNSSKNNPTLKIQKELHTKRLNKSSLEHEMSSSEPESESEVLANSLAADAHGVTSELRSEDEESNLFEMKGRKKKRSTFSLASNSSTVSQNFESKSPYHPESIVQTEQCDTSVNETSDSHEDDIIEEQDESMSSPSHNDSDVVIIDYSDEEEEAVIRPSTSKDSGEDASAKDTSTPKRDKGIVTDMALTPKHHVSFLAPETSTPQRSDEAIVAEETAAALALFSPTRRKVDNLTWICNSCNWENEPSSSLCEACLSDKPESIGRSSMKDICTPWKCKTCDVENKSTDEYCTSCSLPQPIFTSEVAEENMDGKSLYVLCLDKFLCLDKCLCLDKICNVLCIHFKMRERNKCDLCDPLKGRIYLLSQLSQLTLVIPH